MNSNAQAHRAVIRRDRVLVLSCLLGIAALAWLVVLYFSGVAGMMPADLVLTAALWLVMMVAMMTPSVSPTLLMYASILRGRAQRPFLPMGGFLLGYLLLWSGFGVAAGILQLGLQTAISGSALIGGAALLAAGVYQFTPLKYACLTHCRSPQGFFMTEWRDGALGALLMGLKSGVYCLGCCWLLMALLFVTGAMSILWMAVLAGYVLAEKVVPAGVWLGRAAGLALVAAGAWVFVSPLL